MTGLQACIVITVAVLLPTRCEHNLPAPFISLRGLCLWHCGMKCAPASPGEEWLEQTAQDPLF